MVAKINVGESLYGALAYNQKKIDEGNGKVLLTNKMFESEDGQYRIEDCVECFQMQMPIDIRTKKPVIHISLNPHPDDKLSDEQLSEIAKEYMEKLGYGNQPYMVYKHEDINRHHLHIVSIRVDETGKKINDKFEHRRSKEITRELERKYGLHPAEKQKQKEEYQLKKVDYTAGDVKQQISNTVKGLMQTYKFQSFNEFKTLLSLYNIHAEELKGEVNGKVYNGIIYSATDNKGEKQGNPFKSSRLGKSTGYEAIQRKIDQSTKTWKENDVKTSMRDKIEDVLNPNISREEFENQLKDKQIDVIFRENADGRIYGVTFVDHENKTVVNGSRLGRDLSANIFNERFGVSTNNGDTTQTPDQIPDQTPEPPSPREPDSPRGQLDDQTQGFYQNSGSSVASLFNLESSGSDTPYENDQVYPRKKKKKKRKYGQL